MTLWILDTDHLSLIQRQHPTAIQRLASMNPDNVAITTVITAEEQLRGRLNTIRQASNAAQSRKLLEAYSLFRETLEDLKSLSILGFSPIAHVQFAELKQQNLRIGTQDLKIASIALSLNAIVVTRNQRDFGQVPDIQLEDWTMP